MLLGGFGVEDREIGSCADEGGTVWFGALCTWLLWDNLKEETQIVPLKLGSF